MKDLITAEEIRYLQILALDSVENSDLEYQLRRICRWYSKEFCTPLHVVEQEIPLQIVLRHYYENSFSNLKNAAENEGEDGKFAMRWLELKENLTSTEQDEKEQQLQEEDDEQWIREMTEMIEKEGEDNPNLNEEFDITYQGE